MEELFKIVGQIYKDHGVISVIVFTSVILMMFIIYEVIKMTALKILDGKIPFMMDKKINLENHTVFAKLDSIINYQIQNIIIPCPLRMKMFKILLTLRMQCIKEELTEQSKKSWDISREDLRIIWKSFFAKIDFKWNEKAKTSGIPEVVVTKFMEFHKDVYKVLTDLVENLCVRSGTSLTESVSIIFEVIGSLEISSLFTASDALNYLNGEINNINFQGTNCDNCNILKCPKKVGPDD